MLLSILTFGTIGVTSFCATANAQNSSHFADVSSLYGIQMISSTGDHYTVSVAADAYYIQNGLKQHIEGVIGVYELFNHPTDSPLPGSDPFPLMHTNGGGQVGKDGQSNGGLITGDVIYSTSRTSGFGMIGPHTWDFKTSQDSMAFGYEAHNNSMAILASHSLSNFIFTRNSPSIGLHVLAADGKSYFIKDIPTLIPEGSSLLGLSCLILLGSLSISRLRVSKP